MKTATENEPFDFVPAKAWFEERQGPTTIEAPDGLEWFVPTSFHAVREMEMQFGGPLFALAVEPAYRNYLTEDRTPEARRFAVALRDRQPDGRGLRAIHAVAAVSRRARDVLHVHLADDLRPPDRLDAAFHALRDRFDLHDPVRSSTSSRSGQVRSATWQVEWDRYGVEFTVLGRPNLWARAWMPAERSRTGSIDTLASAFEPMLDEGAEVRVAHVLRTATGGASDLPDDLAALLDLAGRPPVPGRETARQLIERRMRASGLDRSALLSRLPSRNRSKVAMRLDEVRDGRPDLPDMIETLSNVLDVPRAELEAAVSRTHARRTGVGLSDDPLSERTRRHRFRPHVAWQTERTRPTSIAMAALAGNALRRHDLPADLPPERWIAHARDAMPDTIPFFGAVTGFALHETPDRTVRCDRAGRVVEEEDGAFVPLGRPWEPFGDG